MIRTCAALLVLVACDGGIALPCDGHPLIGAWTADGTELDILTYHPDCTVTGADNPGLPAGRVTFSAEAAASGSVTYLEDGEVFWGCDYAVTATTVPRQLTLVCDGETSVLVER